VDVATPRQPTPGGYARGVTDDPGAAPSAAAGTAGPAGPADAPAPAEWWEDPSLPWKQRPERADIVCMTALGVVGVYGLVMLPLRPVMLGLAPHVLGSLGYRTGLVMVGALAAVGDPWWPLVLVVGAAMAMKFHWVYWWAGRLWGRDILDVWVHDRPERTRRRYERVWSLTHRFEVPAIVLTFLPLPIPAGVVYAALGAAGTRLSTFLLTCAASALGTSAAYVALGYWIGEPAVQLIDTYGRYLWYYSLALIVGMLVLAWWRQRRQAPTA